MLGALGDPAMMGRHFPIRTKYFEDPKTHWSPDWILAGISGGTAAALAILLFFWLLGR